MNDFFSIPHSRQLTTSANMTEEEFFDCDWNDDGNTAVTLSREEEAENAVFRNINLADAARKLDVVTIHNVLGDAFLNMTLFEDFI